MKLRLYGKEPFIIAVVHGGPGAPGSVAPVAKEMSQYFGVLEPLQTKTTVKGQVDELFNELSVYASFPITLIGHSWGAWLSVIFTNKYPDSINKLILVGSGPFEEKYVDDLDNTRKNRLTKKESEEYVSALKRLNNPNITIKNKQIARLGQLAAKTDNYCVVESAIEFMDEISADVSTYQSVWAEAAAMRKSGELLAIASKIKCPVVAIHGDYDPHPQEGVKMPLEENLKDFRFIMLNNCGHSPWKEKYAKAEFFGILKNEL
jgi:pimeloyl-ACP methyl ester carboxylesterase